MKDFVIAKLHQAFTRLKPISVAQSGKIDRLEVEIEEFFRLALPEIEAWLVSDESKVWNFNFDDGSEVIQRVQETYGVILSRQDLDLHLWQLVEELNRRRLDQSKER